MDIFDTPDIPKDSALERAFLYGFLAETPAPFLPPEGVLDCFDSKIRNVRAAFESGRELARCVSKWYAEGLADHLLGCRPNSEEAEDSEENSHSS
jgi:hypothetical protein